MIVLGPRIRLRPTRYEDLTFLQRLWNDGRVMRYKGYPHGMGVTDACMDRWWATAPQSQQSDIALTSLATPHCLIELLDGPMAIGEFAYSIDAHRRAHIDLKIAHAYWRQGYATEALTLAIRELFARMAVTSVLAEATAENTTAQELYHRLGFQPAPTENHPDRWECTRAGYADRDPLAAVA